MHCESNSFWNSLLCIDPTGRGLKVVDNMRNERMAKLLNTPDRLFRHARQPLLAAKQQSLCHLVGQGWCLCWFGLG